MPINDVARDSSKAYQPNLETSLHHLGMSLHDLRRDEEAMTWYEKSIQVYHDVARDNPNGHQVNLAIALNSLGNTQRWLGCNEKAVLRCRETLQIRRRLDQDDTRKC